MSLLKSVKRSGRKKRLVSNINGRMKVKTLKTDFKKEFGLSIRVYVGVNFADDDATLVFLCGENSPPTLSPLRIDAKVALSSAKLLPS